MMVFSALLSSHLNTNMGDIPRHTAAGR